MPEQFDRPTHIKIDVVGPGTSVVRGARETLDHLGPVLFLEAHNEIIRADSEKSELRPRWFSSDEVQTVSIEGVVIDREVILETPICRLLEGHFGLSQLRLSLTVGQHPG